MDKKTVAAEVKAVEAKVEEKAAEVKADVKVAEKKAAEVKKATEEKAAEVKKAAKKTAAKAEKAVKATAKKAEKTVKTAAKKVEKKVAAKAAEPVVLVQFGGAEKDVAELVEAAKAAFKAEKARTAINDLKLYVKPEEQAAYYVVNGEFTGKVSF